MDIRSKVFELIYHPVSLLLPSIIAPAAIQFISCNGTLTRAEFDSWIVHLSTAIRLPENKKIRYEKILEEDNMMIMRGIFQTSDGLSIGIHTGSHFIDVIDNEGNTQKRLVMAEPFPKRYKMLYDSIKGGE